MNSRLWIFGEVLFDHFPDGQRVLGGAPFNVAWHLQALGQSPTLISRVGDDADGRSVLKAMRRWGLDESSVGVDAERTTGKVEVCITNGEPSYQIMPNCAYDAIEVFGPAQYELLYHGSLAAREEKSKSTLTRLRNVNQGLIFVDLNLRPPWWRREDVNAMLLTANWIKLNNDELELLWPGHDTGGKPLHELLRRYELNGAILTRGSQGAELLTSEGEHYRVSPQSGIRVVDTVGAGDAFAAIVILGLRHHWPLQVILERAQHFASRVVGIRGATTTDSDFYTPFVNEWLTVP